MKRLKPYFMGLSLILMMTAVAPLVFGQAAHVRWDIVSANLGPPVSLSPGGQASATASDTSCITITGSGTFVAPASGGSSSAVTGGGTWKVFAPSGANGTVPATCGTTETSSGNFVVTELVRWEKSNPQPSSLIDNVGNINEAFGGFAVLRVDYLDGTTGVLTISCHAPLDPFSVFEGMIASKGVIQYWYPSIFKYFSLFHVN